MRKFWTGVIFLLMLGMGCPLKVQAALVKAEAKVVRVTVYPDSALVTRSAQIKVISGMQQVEFSGIIPEIDENTLTVSGRGSAEVKLHGAFIKRDYEIEAPDERMRILNQEIQSLQDQLARENAQAQTLQSQREFLKSIQIYSGQQIPKDLATKMPSVTELESLLDFIGIQSERIHNAGEAINLRVRELNEKKAALERERNELRQPSTPLKRSVVVNVEGIKEGTLTLELAFLVQDAAWYPVYDARADFDKGKVTLDNFAMVRQITGEDWTNVDVTLSTAKPSLSGQLPEVTPLILRPVLVAPVRTMAKLMGGIQGRMAQAPEGAVYESASFDSYASEEKKEASAAVSVADFRGTSVAYTLPGPVTVKSDGTDQKLPVSSQELNAAFSYSTYPRVSLAAYLGSRVTNAPDLQLLAGEVNIFLDGDYVGKSKLGATGPGEIFDLFLGQDANVKVERKLVEKKMDETFLGGIPSPNKKGFYKYLISVENYKVKPIDVIVYESTPVSEMDRIRVKISDVKPEPVDKEWKNRPGVWRWESRIEPKAKMEIQYQFEVEHPRDMRVEGLDD